MLRVATIAPPLKLVFAFDFNFAYHHSQHLFMHVDSRYPIRHIVSSWRERRACLEFLKQGHRLSPLPPEGDDNAQLFGSTRTLRIRQLNSLNLSIENSISPLRASPILHSTRINFHELSRAVGPSRQLRQAQFQLTFGSDDKRKLRTAGTHITTTTPSMSPSYAE